MSDRSFTRNYVITFTGAMVVAVFNYLFYPVLARLLDLPAFGEVQSLVALMTVATVIFGALSVVIIHIVATEGSQDEKNILIRDLRRVLYYIVVPLSILVALASVPLAQFFQFRDAAPFAGLALVLFTSTLPLFGTAYLQGKHLFLKSSISAGIVAAGRVLFAALFVIWGWGALGAMGGIAAAQIIALFYILSITRGAFRISSGDLTKGKMERQSLLRRELAYGLLALVANGSIALLFTSDILVVKHYFDPTTAGLYAGISSVAKMGYFALIPLGTVLLPSVASAHDARHRTLRDAMAIFGLCAIAGLVALFVFHDLIVSVLFGARFGAMASLVPIATLGMVLAALANLMTTYFLALRKTALWLVGPLGALIAFILCIYRHVNVLDIIINFLLGALFVVATLGFLYAQDYFRSHPRS